MGTSIEDLYVNKDPWNYYVQSLEPSENHTVLYNHSVSGEHPPEAKASLFNNDFWNSDEYVNMPFYSGNMYEETVVCSI